MPIGERFAQVLSAAIEGADWAWAELYREFAPVLLRFLSHQGVPDPEDVLGECFVHLVRALPTFDGDEAGFRAWAFTVARSRVVDTWRARGRRPVSPTGDVAELLDRTERIGAADGDLLQRDAVLELLATLTEEQRTVLLLRVVEQFSVAETATVMRKSEGAVKVLQNRALNALRRTLDVRGADPRRAFVGPGR